MHSLTLTDRFGNILSDLELLRIPRLRQLARRLGIENCSEQGKMFTYLVTQHKAYYQSDMFGRS